LLSNSLTFKLKQNKLIAVVGSVGSGKSSLLYSVLGELNKFKGKININGSLSYVPQQAWIQNATVKENILFGKAFDKKFYDQVVTCCALKPDFNILAAGDQTEIGEKGINLSGGQKQRISLSRAVYSDSDIFLLDDPLSAVDAHVGKHIFDSVIGPNGILKEKSRLFATNSVAFLPECDEIMMLEDGYIAEFGTYDYLMNKKGKFAEFMENTFLEEPYEEVLETKPAEIVVNQVKSESAKKVTIEPAPVQVPIPSEKRGSKHKNELTYRKASIRNVEKIQVDSDQDDQFKIIQSEKVEEGNVKLSNFTDYFKACSYKNVIIFLLSYILMNVAIFVNHFYLSKWSDQEEAQRVNAFNASIPGGYPENPRNETDIIQRNTNLIIFVSTGLAQRKLLLINFH
jgi:ABC-type multidrug transport system ATPase subunit